MLVVAAAQNSFGRGLLVEEGFAVFRLQALVHSGLVYFSQRRQEPAAACFASQGFYLSTLLLFLGGLLCPCDESSFADRL